MLTTQDAPASPAVTKKSCQFCGFARTNADLLNAAPDLLAALKMLYADPHSTKGAKAAAAAIAKAEGRP
jgi:hypothetical protein